MKSSNSLFSILLCMCLFSCNDNFMSEIFKEPVAHFSIKEGKNAGQYEVFESVVFSNTGNGQSYVVFPGDAGHKYGIYGNTGFATASNGSFAYSYQEVGDYTAVWVASSIKGDGTIITKTDSVKIKVVSSNGGLEQFYLSNFYTLSDYGVTYKAYSKAISPDTLVCPILYSGWNNFKTLSDRNRIVCNYRLSSTLAKLYWIDGASGTEKELKTGSTSSTDGVSFTANSKSSIQKFSVRTASGLSTNYYIAAAVIPNFTRFTVNIGGVDYNAVISRDISYYNRFNVQLSLPSGTDLSTLKPTFEVVGNDPNLTDGSNYEITVNGQKQISGMNVLDFSSKQLVYEINMWVMGLHDKNVCQKSLMNVTIL
jgi:hypothetical protein